MRQNSKNLLPFLSFSDNLLQDAYITFFFVQNNVDHAKFWFGVPLPLKIEPTY